MLQNVFQIERLNALRSQIALLERGGAAASGVMRRALPFGVAAIDGVLPGRGLALGALHEIAGAGSDVASGAAAALFVAGILARLSGPILWSYGRRDLFAPALAAIGLHPDRVIYAETGDPALVLSVMEEGLRSKALAGVVGEIEGRLSLTASRRLQLAAEASRVTAFALRRPYRRDRSDLDAPNAAETRWRIASMPSAPYVPMQWEREAPTKWEGEGLSSKTGFKATPSPSRERGPPSPASGRGLDGLTVGRGRWQLELIRSRGGVPGSWMVEACDAAGRLALFPDLADRSAAPDQWHERIAG